MVIIMTDIQLKLYIVKTHQIEPALINSIFFYIFIKYIVTKIVILLVAYLQIN